MNRPIDGPIHPLMKLMYIAILILAMLFYIIAESVF